MTVNEEVRPRDVGVNLDLGHSASAPAKTRRSVGQGEAAGLVTSET